MEKKLVSSLEDNMKRVLVVGLGNEIMGDDCIVLLVSRKLRDELEEVDVIEWPFFQ